MWMIVSLGEVRTSILELCVMFWKHKIEYFRVYESLVLKWTRAVA